MIYSLIFTLLFNGTLATGSVEENHREDITHGNFQRDITYNKNKIDNYDVITISQSGSLFYSVTNEIIQSVKNLNSNLTFIGRANIGLSSVSNEIEGEKLKSNNNYLYNISIKTIESSVSNLFYSNEVSNIIKNNMIVVSTLTSERYGIEIGDKIMLVGIDLNQVEVEVGAIINDSELGWFEAVVNKEVGYSLGIFRNIQAVIWDKNINENFLIELYKNINYQKIKLSFRENIPNKNWVLPNALVKEIFGDFQFSELDGTWIRIEKKWRNENIQQKRMPLLGLTVCHRLMWEPLEGALNQIIKEGLQKFIFKDEFQTSGGCYAPRRISRFDAGGSISRHAWGIAIDINTKSSYPPRIVEIFNDWGFAWGGTWTSPDEMHFELRDLSASVSEESN